VNRATTSSHHRLRTVADREGRKTQHREGDEQPLNLHRSKNAKQQQCSRLHHRVLAGKRQQPPSLHLRSQGRKEQQTLILERVLCATCQHLIGQSNWSTLVNSGQLVKVSSQLWSKLQIWLNERDRIGNWTTIKLLIN